MSFFYTIFVFFDLKVIQVILEEKAKKKTTNDASCIAVVGYEKSKDNGG